MLQLEHEYLLYKANNLYFLLQSASYLFYDYCRSACACRLAGSGQYAHRTSHDSAFVFGSAVVRTSLDEPTRVLTPSSSTHKNEIPSGISFFIC